MTKAKKSEFLTRLDAAESRKMAEAILKPRKPNAKLREAARRYLEEFESK